MFGGQTGRDVEHAVQMVSNILDLNVEAGKSLEFMQYKAQYVNTHQKGKTLLHKHWTI